MALLLLFLRLILGITLAISGLAKATGRLKFEQTLYNFGFVPVATVRSLSFVIPSTELLTGMLLVIGLFAREAALVAAFLISVFSVGVVLNLIEHRYVECGCFGTLSERPISQWTVWRNVILIGIAATIVAGGAGAVALG